MVEKSDNSEEKEIKSEGSEKAMVSFSPKKGKKAPRNGVVHIQCTFNNTLVTVTTQKVMLLLGLLQV